jgi:dihydrofolate synthase/folylpolyglutamate synthase
VTAETSDQVLERLSRLHPKLIDLSLGRVERLLAALDNPQDKLSPVIHVAGTNGKGSTIATLRACLEAGGYRVHAYISPHLVRFRERIRLAGKLIAEEALIALLEECERANSGTPITYFEITTMSSCSKPGSAGGSTRPMWSTARRSPQSPRSRSTTRPFSVTRSRRSPAKRPAS